MRTRRNAKGTRVTLITEPEVGSRRRTRLSPLAVGVLVALLLIIVGTLIPSPYVIEKPGPVVNTLGEIMVQEKSQPIITVDGVAAESDGRLNLLTVSIVGNPEDRLGWLELVPALLDYRQKIVPLSDVYGVNETAEDREQENKAMMQSSQQVAVAAAMRELGEPVPTTVTVGHIVEGSAAEGVLEVGDQLLTAGGHEVTGTAMVREQVTSQPRGGALEFTVLRDGREMTLETKPQWEESLGFGVLGVVMAADYAVDRDIAFDVDRIGGPSAGMVFSLAIIEALSDEPFLGDAVVSGTGTIDDGGNVGAIGGLPQKMWAAAEAGTELFIMPLGNCADLPKRVPDSMEIAAVETLDEAATAIHNLRNGVPNDGVSRCLAEGAQAAPVG